MTKVIVVDDDRDMCRIISDVLTEEGYRTAIAYNGRTAMTRIKREVYDLMILDYKLSGMSGLSVLEQTRRISPALKVLMISAYGSEPVRLRAKELGAYGFLDKPFDIKELVSVVKRILSP